MNDVKHLSWTKFLGHYFTMYNTGGYIHQSNHAATGISAEASRFQVSWINIEEKNAGHFICRKASNIVVLHNVIIS